MPRQPADIDGEQVRKLAGLGCTYSEIGAWFGVDEKTIRNRFSAEKQQGAENGKLSLRRRQWKRAMEGSDTMLIHLGKQYLNQAEKIEQKNEHSSPDGLPVPEKVLNAMGYYRQGLGPSEPGMVCGDSERRGVEDGAPSGPAGPEA